MTFRRFDARERGDLLRRVFSFFSFSLLHPPIGLFRRRSKTWETTLFRPLFPWLLKMLTRARSLETRAARSRPRQHLLEQAARELMVVESIAREADRRAPPPPQPQELARGHVAAQRPRLRLRGRRLGEAARSRSGSARLACESS